MFSRAFVINLSFKKDRLQQFQSQPVFAKASKTGVIEVWPAVHGDTCRAPDWWTAGNGAWGCYRSHLAILEHCMNHNVESYCVFEDDAIAHQHFADMLSRFTSALPKDWEQAYLGGQLYHVWEHPPIRLSDECFIPYNVNRTHAFAVHSRGYLKLYRHLLATPFAEQEHIDHHLGRLHESKTLRVYCPPRWMVGQGAGWSNISGNFNETMWWNDPVTMSRDHPVYTAKLCVVLFGNQDMAQAMQILGFHQGYWKSPEGIDYGVMDAMQSGNPEDKLRDWWDCVCREVTRDGLLMPCLYHPAITQEHLQQWKFANLVPICPTGATLDEQITSAMEQLSANPLTSAFTPPPVIATRIACTSQEPVHAHR